MRSSQYSMLESEIFDYITETIRNDGYAPTVRDIQKALGIKSTSTVHSYLRRLEEKGLISKESGKSRTLRIDGEERESADASHSVTIPLLGQVRAGMPIMAVENLEGYIEYPLMKHRYPANDLFALRVKGDSMVNAGIFDGDIIVVEKTPYAENGEIAVALVDDCMTVKTFYKEKGHYRLQPENSKMEPIIVDEVLIIGRVIANLRFYR